MTVLKGSLKSVRDFTALEGINAEELAALIDLAETLKDVLERPIKKVPTLRGKAIANVFFEPSTRTRNSFELAAKYMSADVINFQSSGSSVEKGETLWDTARNLAAMAIDAVVIRHQVAGVPGLLADLLDVPVINAGDGMHEHPTQGLLDLLTVKAHYGRIGGLQVAIVGDVLHSRVARSDLWGFTKMGAAVRLVGPPNLLPSELEAPMTSNLEDGIRGCDVIQVLRLQHERQTSGAVPSMREYRERFGVTRERLEKWAPDALVMHPGPQNRGVEIDSEVLDGPQSAVLSQVQYGVAVRMAVLYRLLGGTHDI
ncbi:MAG: aspartate carbamoyltransferase [Sulfobacillus benefaciens]|uniref:Aspartate carbamoyltransferase n=1 Tax=Sulfobacillus benefaciens TaxID=453960 RepID=A0A2T2XE84_9FIRM|nr:MAG: aspartate carbamoyltransferase [Sulfobacillus benefaciens]